MNSTTHSMNIVSILKENGYKITERDSSTVLKKPSTGSLTTFIIFGIIGLTLLTAGIYIGLHATTILSGLVFLGVPLIYERYKYPNTIIINSETKEMTLKSGYTVTRVYRFNDISALEVDESIVTSDVSPFKDGYQDFIYTFKVQIGRNSHKLMNLVFRKESESSVGAITSYLSERLALQTMN